MQGLSIQSLKKHRALIPLFVCVGVGCVGATFYTLRLAVANPDVQWNRNGVVSNEQYREKEYKFYTPTNASAESPAPKY